MKFKKMPTFVGVIVVLLLVVIGVVVVTNGKEADLIPRNGIKSIKVFKTSNFSVSKDALIKEFSDMVYINRIIVKLNSAERIEGILNVAEPDFLLTLEYMEPMDVFLWLPKDGAEVKGMLMFTDRSEEGYSLSEAVAKYLSDLIEKEKGASYKPNENAKPDENAKLSKDAKSREKAVNFEDTIDIDDKEIIGILNEYYSQKEPSNKGELKILATKPYIGGELVLARKYSGEGHILNDLMYIDSGKIASNIGSGFAPVSMCFSADEVLFGGNYTIAFGSFNDEVDIRRMKVEFKNGESYEEDVSADEGYIVVSRSNVRLKNIVLYDEAGNVQSTLDEIGYVGLGSSKEIQLTRLQEVFDEVSKIEVYYSYFDQYFEEFKPTVISDSKLISEIKEMLLASSLESDNPNMAKISGKFSRYNKLVLLLKDGSKVHIPFTFEDLYDVGYVKYGETNLYPSYDFFRYVSRFNEFRNVKTDVEEDVLSLFNRYGWTALYRINSFERTLPENLKHGGGDYPDKIYWAVSRDISKYIGLDFTPYLGREVTAEIYYLKEPLPEYFHPNMNARGIVVRFEGEIVGAYIDCGRHRGFGCSLDGKSLKDVTGKDWDEWVADHIDNQDPLEQRIAAMTPEELIRTYYEAQDNDDDRLFAACLSRENLSYRLYTNMDNNKLYNGNLDDSRMGQKSYIDTVEVIKITETNGRGDSSVGSRHFIVELDMKVREHATTSSGRHHRFISIIKEGGSWKVTGDNLG